MPRPRNVALEVELLAGVHRELSRLRQVNLTRLPREAWRLKWQVQDALTAIVWADMDTIIGRALTDAERRAYQRAARRLVADGVLRRHLGWGGVKTTALELVRTRRSVDMRERASFS